MKKQRKEIMAVPFLLVSYNRKSVIEIKIFGRTFGHERTQEIVDSAVTSAIDAYKAEIDAGRKPNAPAQQTQVYPYFNGYAMGVAHSKIPTPKVTLQGIRQFSYHPVPRRAINVIKRQVSSLDWIVVPKEGVTKDQTVTDHMRIAKNVLNKPNNADSFRTLWEMVVEDILALDAGSLEKRPSGDPERPLFLWAVDGASVQIYPEWTGQPTEPRYAQNPGYGGNTPLFVDLLDSELIYIRANPRTNSPYGIAPLEVVWKILDYLTKAMNFAGKTAGNALAKKMINLGPSADPDLVKQVEAYLRTMIAGSGKTPVIGGLESAGAFDIGAPDDSGLYLAWQHFLIVLIAVSFDVSPRRLGEGQNSNRSTAESEDSNDMDAAIRPLAKLLEEHINREIIGDLGLGFDDVQFKFILAPGAKAQELMSNVHYKYGMLGVMTVNEIRSRLGMEKLTSEFGDMTYPEMMAALGHSIGKEQIGDQNRLQNPDSVVDKN